MEQMQSDEQMVRGVWDDVRICSQPDLNGRNMAYWWVIANGKGPLSKTVEKSEAQTWMALAAFTRERLEEVRQLWEEIELVRSSYQTSFQIGKGVAFHDITRKKMAADASVWQRVLDRLEAALADKTAGMKAGA